MCFGGFILLIISYFCCDKYLMGFLFVIVRSFYNEHVTECLVMMSVAGPAGYLIFKGWFFVFLLDYLVECVDSCLVR
jgi:hypothetical protein